MNRREMVIKSLQAGVLLALNPFESLISDGKNKILSYNLANQLRIPPVINGGQMTLAQGNFSVWPGQQTQVIAINGTFPGPTVKVTKGNTFDATLVNNHTQEATIHWHGLITPELMDGHPKDAVMPGNSYNYTYPVFQRGGTYFYHSHAHMLTGEQVYKGFSGFYIIEDPAELQLGLPSGNFDIPLVIQDRRTVNIPQFTYNPAMIDQMRGFLGDLPLVNGTPDPFLNVSRTLYRFRLLNGSNARIYKAAFSDNHPFHVIATDGGLKDVPVQTTSFFLAPGERVDILVDFSSYSLGQNVYLKSLPFTDPGMGTYRQGLEMNLLRFDINGNTPSGGVIPQNLSTINYYQPENAVRTRTFTLEGSGMEHTINGLTFEMNRIDFEVPQNDLEEWKFLNTQNEFHPMHIHGAMFQVVSRNNNTNLPPNDKGWKDTVLVNPLETVSLLIKFTDYKGIFMLHCHNLEHEDHGMMQNFRVIDQVGIDEKNEIASDFKLEQNYPNPFNPSTTISFSLAGSGHTKLEVFDVSGKIVKVLLDKIMNAGRHEAIFNAGNLASGVYYYKLTHNGSSVMKKMVLIK